MPFLQGVCGVLSKCPQVFPAQGPSALLAPNWQNGWRSVKPNGHPGKGMEDSSAAQNTD